MRIEKPDFIRTTAGLNQQAKDSATAGLIQLRWTLKNFFPDDQYLPEVESSLKAVLGETTETTYPRAVIDNLVRQNLIDHPEEILNLMGWADYRLPSEKTTPTREAFERVTKVGIVGPIAGGKETIGQILAARFNSVHIAFSPGLRALAHAIGMKEPFSRQDLRDINDTFKPDYGDHIFVEWAFHQAKRLSSRSALNIVSFDGFRTLNETGWFLKHENAILVGVTASAETRFRSMNLRNRVGEDGDYKTFSVDDDAELPLIEPIMRKYAQTIFDNEGTGRQDITADRLDLANEVIEYFEKIVERPPNNNTNFKSFT